MAETQELLDLERGFWTKGGDYYRDHVDDECLLAFAEVSGLFSNDEIVGMNPGAGWRNVDMSEKGISELSDDAAILSYEVSAERSDGEPYHAIVSSGYVRRDGEWKLAFHQHTPLDDRMN